MSRSYRHIQECNKEIIELKHNGCPVRQICEKYKFNKDFDGNLGQDVFLKFNSLIINFENMYIDFN